MSSSASVKHVHLTCVCSDPSHIVRVELERHLKKDNSFSLPNIYITVQLNPLPVWKRVYYALRYVFNIKVADPTYSGYATKACLDKASIDKLSNMIIAWRLIRKLRKAKRTEDVVLT